MKKPGVWLISVFLTLCSFRPAADVRAPMSLHLSSNLPGFAYETAFKTRWFVTDLSLLFNFHFASWSIGLQSDIDYISYSSFEEAVSLEGARFDVRMLATGELDFSTWLRAKAGLGGLWLHSTLNYERTGWYGSDQGGLSALINLMFKLPWTFLELEWENKLDLLFVTSALELASGPDLYYKGGLKATCYPGISWIAVFTCLSLSYWQTTSAAIRSYSWIFNVNAGITVKFNLTSPEKDKPDESHPPLADATDAATTRPPETATDKADTTVTDRKPQTYEQISPALRLLYEAGAGEKINFSDIIFRESSTELLPSSQTILDYILEILTVKPALIISISGYAEYYKDPKKEIALATSRANFIRNYLIGKGIEKGRLKISPVTQLAVKDSTTRVVISVLSTGVKAGSQ